MIIVITSRFIILVYIYFFRNAIFSCGTRSAPQIGAAGQERRSLGVWKTLLICTCPNIHVSKKYIEIIYFLNYTLISTLILLSIYSTEELAKTLFHAKDEDGNWDRNREDHLIIGTLDPVSTSLSVGGVTRFKLFVCNHIHYHFSNNLLRKLSA